MLDRITELEAENSSLRDIQMAEHSGQHSLGVRQACSRLAVVLAVGTPLPCLTWLPRCSPKATWTAAGHPT